MSRPLFERCNSTPRHVAVGIVFVSTCWLWYLVYWGSGLGQPTFKGIRRCALSRATDPHRSSPYLQHKLGCVEVALIWRDLPWSLKIEKIVKSSKIEFRHGRIFNYSNTPPFGQTRKTQKTIGKCILIDQNARLRSCLIMLVLFQRFNKNTCFHQFKLGTFHKSNNYEITRLLSNPWV